MARVNIDPPDRPTGRAAAEWLARTAELTPLGVEHESVLDAIDAAREELAGGDDA